MLSSLQRICKFRRNMIDPFTSQDTSAPRRSHAFKWTRAPPWHMPKCVMEHLSIPAHRLSVNDTNIFGFNANSTRPMGKIKLRWQIGDLKSEVTVYIIDADTSYNLLLGQPWIHKNQIVPSTLHQGMKYGNTQGQVRKLVVEQHPFRGVETHFTNSLLYQKASETNAREAIASESGN